MNADQKIKCNMKDTLWKLLTISHTEERNKSTDGSSIQQRNFGTYSCIVLEEPISKDDLRQQ